MRTDDPRVVLLALRIVEAIMLEDQGKLIAALRDARGDAFTVMLSIAAFAADLLVSAPGGPAKLREWLIASELEQISDTPEDDASQV